MAVLQAHPERPLEALVAAFDATDFVVFTDPPLTVQVGVCSPTVRDWLVSLGKRSVTVITAWNPFSRTLPDAENGRRNAQLAEVIARRGFSLVAAEGRGRDGCWPPEESFAAFDVPAVLIDQWLIEFEQYAVVACDLSGECSLRWHPGVAIKSQSPPGRNVAAEPLQITTYSPYDGGDFSEGGPRPTRGAKHVVTVEWPGSPVDSLRETFWLHTDRMRAAWYLAITTQCEGTRLYARGGVLVPRKAATARDAALQMIEALWTQDRLLDCANGRGGVVTREGLLSAGDIRRIESVVFD